MNPNNPDNIAIRPQLAGKFIKLVKEQLGDDYIIIATPFDIDVINADYKKVVVDELTLKEFLDKYNLPLDKNE